MDLYQTLGVDRSATKEEIRAAYRSLCQKHHPDKNGGQESELFTNIRLAYDCLSDPVKREHYDRTGNTEIDNIDRVAVSRIAQAFDQAVQQLFNHDDKSIDIIQRLIDGLARSTTEIERKIADTKRNSEKCKKLLDRIEYNGKGNDLWAGVLNQKIQQFEQAVTQLEHELKIMGRALELLDEYKTKDIQPATQFGYAYIPTGSATSTF